MPSELPSAFAMGKCRLRSELSKKFRFHVLSPEGGRPTGFAHRTTFEDQADAGAF